MEIVGGAVLAILSGGLLVRALRALIAGSPDRYPHEHLHGALLAGALLTLALNLLVRRPALKWTLLGLGILQLVLLFASGVRR